MGLGDLARQAKHRARMAKHHASMARRGVDMVRDNRARRKADAPLRAAVREAMELPSLDNAGQGIWAIAMVRDEADVIERTLRHLAGQGVDQILVVDNGSTDGTRDILAALSDELPLEVGDDRMVAYEQSAKMTYLADIARESGARWIVPFDADELWFGTEGTIAESITATWTPILKTEMLNAFPLAEEEGRWGLDPTFQTHRKVAFRSFPGAILEMGNHEVKRPGTVGPGLGIVHLPWRSFEHFARKTRQGADALARSATPIGYGRHWRELGALDEEMLRERWEELLRGEAPESMTWRAQDQLIPVDLDQLTTWQAVQQALESGPAAAPPGA